MPVALADAATSTFRIGDVTPDKLYQGDDLVWQQAELPEFDSIGAGANLSGNISWTHTIAGNCVIVWVTSQYPGAASTPAVTVGGVPATLLGSWPCGTSGGSSTYLRCFRLMDPPTGAQTVAYTGGGYSAGNSISYFGVQYLGTPVVTAGPNGPMSLTVPNTVDTTLYCMASSYTAAVAGSATYSAFNQTQRFLQPRVFTVNESLLIGDAAGNGGDLSFTATRSYSALGWGAVCIPLAPVLPPGDMSIADKDAIDAIVLASFAGQPGISIATAGPAGNYTKSYGSAGTRPLDPADHFRCGSVTKSFVSTSILRQVDLGTLALTDTVDQYVDDIPNGDIITIQHMLMMRSGLYEYTSSILMQIGLNPTAPFSAEQALALIQASTPLFDPGTDYQYSNSNYILLGFVLEAITGRLVEDIITEDILVPCGLTETSWPTTTTLPSPYSNGYGANPLSSIPVLGWLVPATSDQTAIHPGIMSAAGCMVSTVGDLVKWAGIMRDGTLLSPESHELWLDIFCPQPHALDGGPDEFGYGLGFISFGTWFGHDGSIPGFECTCFFEENTGAVIAAMANYQTGGLQVFTKTFHRIADYLYPGSMDSVEYTTCPY